MKQKKLIFNFFVYRNWKKLTDSRRRAKILADNRKSHHPIETLLGDGPLEMTGGGVAILKKGFFTGHWSDMLSRRYKALYVFIVLFKIRDASGERKYLITASNLTELTLTLNKNSKNGLLNCSFIRFI